MLDFDDAIKENTTEPNPNWSWKIKKTRDSANHIYWILTLWIFTKHVLQSHFLFFDNSLALENPLLFTKNLLERM